MSRLISETDEYVIIEQYVYHNSDELSDWLFEGDAPRFSDAFIEFAEGIFYQYLIRAKVYKNAKDYEIVFVKDGDRKLT